MARRPCIEPGCPNLATRGPRCEGHRLNRERARNRRREGAKTWGRRTTRRALNARGWGTCVTCTTTYPASQLRVDHIVPLADGGTDTLDNIQILCVDHHDAKTAAEHAARTTDH